ncbi:TPA: hypothetical protein ACJIWH_004856, partial [Yersinia enterocolitica]
AHSGPPAQLIYPFRARGGRYTSLIRRPNLIIHFITDILPWLAINHEMIMTIIRKILVASFAMIMAISAHAEMKMERIDFPSLKLSIEIPQTFTPMPEDMAKIKYPSEKRPLVIYGDERGKASLGITAGRSAMSAAKLDMMKETMLKMLTNYSPQAEAMIVDGHKAWLITFRSQAADTEILNMLLMTSENEKAVQVSFNMTKDLETQYQDVARATLLSLKFDK